MKQFNARVIKSLFTLAIFSGSFILNSCKKDLDPIAQIGVSQGTYMGIVHLSWDPVENAEYYNIERQGPDGEWRAAGTVTNSPFDDYGFNLGDNKLVEGVKYNYRVISASRDIGDSDPAYAQNQGWIYEMKPIDLTVSRNEDASITLHWTDSNQNVYDTYGNSVQYYYVIERAYEDDMDFNQIHTTDHGGGDQTYIDEDVATDKTAIYRITGRYEYQYKNMDDDYVTGINIKTYAEVSESGGGGGGGGGGESQYDVENLNDLPQSGDGYGYVYLKNINDDMYLVTIPNPAFGSPVVYKLNGTSWQNISNDYPAGLQQNYDKVSICGNGTTLWVAGVSDSAYIYRFDGDWSTNLASLNLGLTSKPDNIMVEYNDNKLYAIVDHDSKLDLFSLDDNNMWNQENMLEDNASVFDLGFENFNGELYVCYTVSNSSNNSTIKIKHLSGGLWQSDFEQAYDNVMNVRFAVADNGDVYFTSDSQSPGTWQGNVFKVTSLNSAQELVGSSNTWLTFPQNIAFDNNGNVVVLYGKFVSASEPVEMHLAVYESNEWKVISGDFSNHISPATIESNNGIYFIYGDGINTVNSYPTVLKANIFTK